MAHHGGGGHTGGEVPVPTGAPHAGPGIMALALGLTAAFVWLAARRPRTFGQTVLLAVILLPIIDATTTGGDVLTSTPACVIVLAGGWWLSGRLRAEDQAIARKKNGGRK